MGQEISDSRFDAAAFERFQARLDEETALLGCWLADGRVPAGERRFGLEVEGCLVDAADYPAPQNQAFLERLADPLVVSELARFNFEINTDPLTLADGALDEMHAALAQRWQGCASAARGLGLQALMIGILPTLQVDDLTPANMTPLERYRAINDQVFRLRHGVPLDIDIDGHEELLHQHADVMLEAATTSLQIHVQVGADEAARAYNVSKMVSAVTVGAAGNSPFLFGRQLWKETRVPLFEQAVAVGGSDYSKRVTFGVRYARDSILECFEANRTRYPVLLPDVMDEPVETLAHLRLHNGTIWRWNRPLIGFDDAGRPHCRIEHRVVPAGPTVADALANTALFLGLFEALMRSDEALEARLPFATARDNFYAAARDGLEAPIRWLDGEPRPLGELLRGQLLDAAQEGLQAAGLGEREARRWLDPIRGRVERQQTGADWQIAWARRHGRDLAALVQAYIGRQADDRPVHEWSTQT
jgi:gamma-glutamyl:cysteine ligase YbdK (ATP-grasp superfamily)